MQVYYNKEDFSIYKFKDLMLRCDKILNPSVRNSDTNRKLNSLAKQFYAYLQEKAESDETLDQSETSYVLHQLTHWFFNIKKFKDDRNSYTNSDGYSLSFTLKNKNGSLITLGVILMYLAASRGINLYPLYFPYQYFLSAYDGDEDIIINPWSGKIDGAMDDMLILYNGHENLLGEIPYSMLETESNDAASRRLLYYLKSSFAFERNYPKTLEVLALEMSLFPEFEFELTKERGFILLELNCINAALHDINYCIKCDPKGLDSDFLYHILDQIAGEKQTIN